jgi:hypothetical protein
VEKARQYSAVTNSEWISLADVIGSLFTPIAIVLFGFILNKRLKHFEEGLEEQRRTSNTRFELYKDIGFQLNDIFAYFSFIGSWKAFSASDIVGRKRELDRHIFTYRPLFSAEFGQRYDRFMAEAFSVFGGIGKDARLRTTALHRPEEGDALKADCFTEEDNEIAIMEAYQALMGSLADEVGFTKGLNK